VDIAGCSLQAAEAAALAGSLGQLAGLESLRLQASLNPLGDAGFSHIVAALSGMQDLHTLTLEVVGTGISDLALRDLSMTLQRLGQGVKLQKLELDLGHNEQIGAAGAFDLSQGLQKLLLLSNLKLGLRNSRIGDVGVQTLSSAFERMEAVKFLSLDLAFTGIQEDATMESLSSGLNSTALSWLELDLAGDAATEAGYEKFQVGLQQLSLENAESALIHPPTTIREVIETTLQVTEPITAAPTEEPSPPTSTAAPTTPSTSAVTKAKTTPKPTTKATTPKPTPKATTKPTPVATTKPSTSPSSASKAVTTKSAASVTAKPSPTVPSTSRQEPSSESSQPTEAPAAGSPTTTVTATDVNGTLVQEELGLADGGPGWGVTLAALFVLVLLMLGMVLYARRLQGQQRPTEPAWASRRSAAEHARQLNAMAGGATQLDVDVEDPPQVAATARRLEPFHVNKASEDVDGFNPNAGAGSNGSSSARHGGGAEQGTAPPLRRAAGAKASAGGRKFPAPRFSRAEDSDGRGDELSRLAGPSVGASATGSRPGSLDSPGNLSQADSLDLMIDELGHRE